MCTDLILEDKAKEISFRQFAKERLLAFVENFSVSQDSEKYAAGYAYICKKCATPTNCEVYPWANLLLPLWVRCPTCGAKWKLFE